LKGDLTNGIYVDYGNMIPGAGWASVGPGYKQRYAKDSLFVDASAAISVHNYRMAQARVEAPKFLKSRLALGTLVRWLDFGRVDYFDVGPATSIDNRSIYGIESTQLSAFATLRPFLDVDINGQTMMNPVTNPRRSVPAAPGEHTFVPMSATIDSATFRSSTGYAS
jgi:hypothetical protein